MKQAALGLSQTLKKKTAVDAAYRMQPDVVWGMMSRRSTLYGERGTREAGTTKPTSTVRKILHCKMCFLLSYAAPSLICLKSRKTREHEYPPGLHLNSRRNETTCWDWDFAIFDTMRMIMKRRRGEDERRRAFKHGWEARRARNILPGKGRKVPQRRVEGDSIHHLLESLASSDALDLETDLFQLLLVEDESSIKDESGLVHRVVDLLPVEITELVPLCSDDDAFRSDTCFHCALADCDLLLGWKSKFAFRRVHSRRAEW